MLLFSLAYSTCCHYHSDTFFFFPAAAAEPVSPVARETISVKLLTSVRPGDPASSSPPAIGLNTQEQLVRDHWFSALNLTEDWTACTHIAGRGIKKRCLLLTSASSSLLSFSKILSLSLINTLKKENIRFHFLHGPSGAGRQR